MSIAAPAAPPTPTLRRPSERSRGIVVVLLETYTEARDACLERGAGGGGDNVPQLAKLWREGSYAQLDEILRYMRSQSYQQAFGGHKLGRLYWHVCERYIRCGSRIAVRSWVEHRTVGGHRKTSQITRRVVVPVTHPDLRADRVELGVDWITLEFDRRFELGRKLEHRNYGRWQPQVPGEYRDRIAA